MIELSSSQDSGKKPLKGLNEAVPTTEKRIENQLK